MKILFVTSEAHPLVKTGGLGDVSASLPAALRHQGQEVRLVLPAYRDALRETGSVRVVANLTVSGYPVRIFEGSMPDSDVCLWLVDSPAHFEREGGPYIGPDGKDWPDNPARFALFAKAAVELAMDRAGLNWKPDVVHSNDWQSGLVSALLALEPARPGTVFTIHNLAYQGLFPAHVFTRLGLPGKLWTPDGVEFYGHFSFIKGGLSYADRITTVSPTYAKEIRTPEYGYGLEGLLTHRAQRLEGILNGVDYGIWDPSRDPVIKKTYSAAKFGLKAENKRALQESFGLPTEEKTPLIGLVGRMVEQKGIDLVVAALPDLLARPIQVVALGNGESSFEKELLALAQRHPGQLGVRIGYDEILAHLIEAGADMFLMPSRFEPCGLNQLYSLRYGTPPIVRRTGGLADTVVDADEDALKKGTATGFVFEEADPAALAEAVRRALDLYANPRQWRRIATNGMAQDFSWDNSARHYLDVYRRSIKDASAVIR